MYCSCFWSTQIGMAHFDPILSLSLFFIWEKKKVQSIVLSLSFLQSHEPRREDKKKQDLIYRKLRRKKRRIFRNFKLVTRIQRNYVARKANVVERAVSHFLLKMSSRQLRKRE